MAPRVHKPTLQAIFDQRSASIYYAMATRVGEKRSPTGALLRAGRTLPFSKETLAAWILSEFRSVDRSRQCTYCTVSVTVQSFVLDHRTPIAAPWYGSLALSNLAIACGSCNRRKGKMSEAGFRRLVAWGLRELDPRDFADILGRLARAGGVYPERKARQQRLTSPAPTLLRTSMHV